MLKLTIPAFELFDDDEGKFISFKEQTIQLEHSLVSLSKWESKWCKPFLTSEIKSIEETIDYIRCMTITQNVNPTLYSGLTQNNLNRVNEYIEAPMTATVISNIKKTGGRQIITSEKLYYQMIAFSIPFECQKWHLNRLLTLINVCRVKNQPAKKMSKRDIMSQNAAINAERRKQMNSKG